MLATTLEIKFVFSKILISWWGKQTIYWIFGKYEVQVYESSQNSRNSHFSWENTFYTRKYFTWQTERCSAPQGLKLKASQLAISRQCLTKIQTIIISQFHQLIVKHGWSEEFGTDKLSSSEWLDREGIESCEQGSWGIFSYTSDRYSVMFVYPTLHYTLIELG